MRIQAPANSGEEDIFYPKLKRDQRRRATFHTHTHTHKTGFLLSFIIGCFFPYYSLITRQKNIYKLRPTNDEFCRYMFFFFYYFLKVLQELIRGKNYYGKFTEGNF